MRRLFSAFAISIALAATPALAAPNAAPIRPGMMRIETYVHLTVPAEGAAAICDGWKESNPRHIERLRELTDRLEQMQKLNSSDLYNLVEKLTLANMEAVLAVQCGKADDETPPPTQGVTKI